MAIYSGLKKISDWVTNLKPLDWFSTRRNAGTTSQNVWKSEQSDKDKFVAKHKLAQNMKRK